MDYIDSAGFHSDFAADLPDDVANFAAYAQIPIAETAFHYIVKNRVRKIKPCWYVAAQSDRIFSADFERMNAKKAHSYKVEIRRASCSVYESHPVEVAELIAKSRIRFQVKFK